MQNVRFLLSVLHFQMHYTAAYWIIWPWLVAPLGVETCRRAAGKKAELSAKMAE